MFEIYIAIAIVASIGLIWGVLLDWEKHFRSKIHPILLTGSSVMLILLAAVNTYPEHYYFGLTAGIVGSIGLVVWTQEAIRALKDGE